MTSCFSFANWPSPFFLALIERVLISKLSEMYVFIVRRSTLKHAFRVAPDAFIAFNARTH